MHLQSRQSAPSEYLLPDLQGRGPGPYASRIVCSCVEDSPGPIDSRENSSEQAFKTSFKNGPSLLPKIRNQDQMTEPVVTTIGPVRHGRSISLMSVPSISTNFSVQAPYFQPETASPVSLKLDSPLSVISSGGAVCPHGISSHSSLTAVTAPITTDTTTYTHQVNPISSRLNTTPPPNYHALPASGHSLQPMQDSRRTSLSAVRSTSQPVETQNHARSKSYSSIDEAVLLKYGYPTQYRKMPQYISAATQMSTLRATDATSMSVQSPGLYSMLQQYENYIAAEYRYGAEMSAPIKKRTSLLNYLVQPCSQPNLISRSNTDKQRHWDYGWWDIRNLRSWPEFNVDAILAVPEFASLLNFSFDADSLPQPLVINPTPETEYSLRDLYANFFATKVNAGLKVALGPVHPSLRSVNSATSKHTPKPDFISSYAHDVLRTHAGETRGRLVGIVKAYEEWNTGMRSKAQTPTELVRYLKGLAHLHRIMREHRCRYGFIITEIEILCVRAGAEDDLYQEEQAQYQHGLHPGAAEIDQGPRPIFGQLETAAPISLSTTSFEPETGKPRMTAALALWFLLIIAKDEAPPGYPPWQIAVGGPAAVTRKHHLTRDAWMPKVTMQEQRTAKRIRGWVYPEEALSKKELPNSRRRRT